MAVGAAALHVGRRHCSPLLRRKSRDGTYKTASTESACTFLLYWDAPVLIFTSSRPTAGHHEL